MDPILLSIPDEFESDRLIIRRFETGDGEEFFRLVKSNSDHLREEMNEVDTFKSSNDAEIRNRKLIADWILRKRLVHAVVLKETKKMIGEIWMEPISWENRVFDIGYFITKQLEGKGYITEAVKATLKYLFSSIGVQKVEIHTKDNNPKSYKVAERCGFVKEGHLKKRDKLKSGEVVGVYFYGLTKDQYDSSLQ